MMHAAQVREKRDAYMVLIVEPGGKSLVRSCCKLDYTTKLYLIEGVAWVHLAQHCAIVLGVVNTTMNLRVT
jgi:hypothetical protein